MNHIHSSSGSRQGWWSALTAVFRKEFGFVFHDPGVMLFFFALPLFYPVVYTLIYNPETVKEIHIAVVDQCRTARSRELTRMVDATDAIQVYAQVPTVDEARRLQNNHEIYGILHIPADYDRKIGRSEQANVIFYSDMGLLLRYRAFVSALSDVQLALGSEIRTESMDRLGMVASSVSTPTVNQEANMIGDPTQGFASFIIPGIVILILQQSMLLGVTMLAAGGSERRRRNGFYDPLAVPAPPTATIIGKALCYVAIYIPLVLYVVHLVPEMFSLPHIGNIWHEVIFLLPMLIATAFMGIALSVFVTERESSMLVIVFTSVFLLFLSGLTWPRYAMSGFWTLAGDCVPAIRGMEGFIRMNSNGATLADESHTFAMLWVLAAVYFVLAWILVRYRDKSRRLAAGTLPGLSD